MTGITLVACLLLRTASPAAEAEQVRSPGELIDPFAEKTPRAQPAPAASDLINPFSRPQVRTNAPASVDLVNPFADSPSVQPSVPAPELIDPFATREPYPTPAPRVDDDLINPFSPRTPAPEAGPRDGRLLNPFSR